MASRARPRVHNRVSRSVSRVDCSIDAAIRENAHPGVTLLPVELCRGLFTPADLTALSDTTHGMFRDKQNLHGISPEHLVFLAWQVSHAGGEGEQQEGGTVSVTNRPVNQYSAAAQRCRRCLPYRLSRWAFGSSEHELVVLAGVERQGPRLTRSTALAFCIWPAYRMSV